MSNLVKGSFIVGNRDVDSAGNDFVVLEPLQGGLSIFAYGVPTVANGGPKVGTIVETYLRKRGIERSFSYMKHTVVDGDALNAVLATAEEYKPMERTQAPKELTDAERAERKAKREALKLARSADAGVAAATPAPAPEAAPQA